MDDPISKQLPAEPYERALALQKGLTALATGDETPLDDAAYTMLRREFMAGPHRDLLPVYVRTCRSLAAFWPVAKEMSSTWAGRRGRIASDFTPLLDVLEGHQGAPSDAVNTGAITSFNADGVRAAWDRALQRRETDPEGAITAARTLLETVCKHVLDDARKTYTDADDLPKLYRMTAEQLSIAPSQHAEDAFKRVLGGCVSVVEGLGSLRNKIGDAHGSGRRPVRPSARHAQLAVNLAGAMAVFIIETWGFRQAATPADQAQP